MRIKLGKKFDWEFDGESFAVGIVIFVVFGLPIITTCIVQLLKATK